MALTKVTMGLLSGLAAKVRDIMKDHSNINLGEAQAAAGEIYRIMGSAASDNGAVLSADILPSGATMPSIRIDIRGK